MSWPDKGPREAAVTPAAVRFGFRPTAAWTLASQQLVEDPGQSKPTTENNPRLSTSLDIRGLPQAGIMLCKSNPTLASMTHICRRASKQRQAGDWRHATSTLSNPLFCQGSWMEGFAHLKHCEQNPAPWTCTTHCMFRAAEAPTSSPSPSVTSSPETCPQN